MPITTMKTTDSMREPTPKPAMTAAPKGSQQPGHHRGCKRLDDVAGHGRQANVQDLPRRRPEPRERSTDHVFLKQNQYTPIRNEADLAITNDHAAPSTPSAGMPSQPKIRKGPTSTWRMDPAVITIPG